MRRCLAGLLALAASIAPLQARDVAGDFDFYVLALSWSPSYCELDDNPDPSQCDRPRGFIVHGLWPQYERGYPESCPSRLPSSVPRGQVDALADIMPSGGLVRHEWRTHGLCSGLGQRPYFDLLRKAFFKVRQPFDYALPEEDRKVSPMAIEAAFMNVNLGLARDGIAVTCRSGALADVRICLTKDLRFRSCPEVDRDACRGGQILMPGLK